MNFKSYCSVSFIQHTACVQIHTYSTNTQQQTPATHTHTHTHTHTEPHLLPPLLLALVLGGLQHLLLPQVEEVRRVGVELQCVLLVVPERKTQQHF